MLWYYRNLNILRKTLIKIRNLIVLILPTVTEALDILKELAEKNPDEYNPAVGMTQSSLGMLYQNLGRFEEAEHANTEALDILKELAEKNPDAYLPIIAMVWYNKACLESIRNNKEKSIEFLKNSIEIDKSFIENSKTDEDFDNIRNSKEFKELIEK